MEIIDGDKDNDVRVQIIDSDKVYETNMWAIDNLHRAPRDDPHSP